MTLRFLMWPILTLWSFALSLTIVYVFQALTVFLSSYSYLILKEKDPIFSKLAMHRAPQHYLIKPLKSVFSI